MCLFFNLILIFLSYQMTTIQLELLHEMKKQQIARTKLAVICTCIGF